MQRRPRHEINTAAHCDPSIQHYILLNTNNFQLIKIKKKYNIYIITEKGYLTDFKKCQGNPGDTPSILPATNTNTCSLSIPMITTILPDISPPARCQLVIQDLDLLTISQQQPHWILGHPQH